MMRSLFLLLFTLCCVLPASAQEAEDEEEEKKLGWSNVADVGLVVTAGNSSTSTFSFDDKLTYAWEGADFIFRAGALRVRTPDDPFAVGTPEDFEVIEDSPASWTRSTTTSTATTKKTSPTVFSGSPAADGTRTRTRASRTVP